MNTTAMNSSDPVEAQVPVIVINTSKGVVTIPVWQIIRIQSIGSYSKLFFNNGKSLVVAKVLHLFEDLPQLSSFVRIHRKHLVNTDYIEAYHTQRTFVLILNNGETIAVARRKKRSIGERLSSLNNDLTGHSSNTCSFNTKKTLAA